MTAQVVPFLRPKPIQPVCSFCKRNEGEVLKLFGNGLEGPDFKAICNDCVAHAAARKEETQ